MFESKIERSLALRAGIPAKKIEEFYLRTNKIKVISWN
jgi:hypothetical protein